MNKTQTNRLAAAPSSAADRPRRLGRGLSSLLGAPVAVEIPTGAGASGEVEPPRPRPPSREAAESAPSHGPGDAAAGASSIVMIPIDRIVPNRFQPRRAFEEAGLAELAASIRSAGVVQPVLVRRRAQAAGGAEFELVAGERRWRASRLAGLDRVPAVVGELSDEQAAEWALIENVQRTDLSAMETAYALRELCERFSLTHGTAAEKLGIDRTSVTNLIRLTELEPEVRDLLERGELSAGHGKLLLSMKPGAARVGLAKRAAASGWSVRRLGSVVGVASRGGEAPKAEGAGLDPETPDRRGFPREALAHAGMRELEKQLGEHLGTKVQIRVRLGGKRGSLLVHFYDLDHFDGLMGKMGFVMK